MASLPLIRTRSLGGGYHVLVLDDADMEWQPEPGQFYMVSAPGYFLRRPFGMAFRKPGELGFLVQVRGGGTQALVGLKAGASISVLGPCGNGFGPLDEGDVLVGGGIGVAPLLSAVQAEVEAGRTPPTLIAGFKGRAEEGVVTFLREWTDPVVVFEEGEGPSSTALSALCEKIESGATVSRVIACGPEGFLEAVSRYTEERSLPCLLSLEARMGCGYGVCLGCAVPAREGGYRLVCKDGPVVDSRTVRL